MHNMSHKLTSRARVVVMGNTVCDPHPTQLWPTQDTDGLADGTSYSFSSPRFIPAVHSSHSLLSLCFPPRDAALNHVPTGSILQLCLVALITHLVSLNKGTCSKWGLYGGANTIMRMLGAEINYRI